MKQNATKVIQQRAAKVEELFVVCTWRKDAQGFSNGMAVPEEYLRSTKLRYLMARDALTNSNLTKK